MTEADDIHNDRILRSTKVQKRKVKHNSTTSTGANTNQFINHASHLKTTRMNEMKRRKRDFFRRINYGYTFTVVVLPLLSFIYLFQYSESILPANPETLYFSCIYYNFTILAFTTGYHKYFAHNSFKVRYRFLQYYFAIFGSSVGLGSIRWWASLHRAHHHFTDDTERDPYLIKRGFFWAHWGWLIKKPKIVSFYQKFIEQEFPTIRGVTEGDNEVAGNLVAEGLIEEIGTGSPSPQRVDTTNTERTEDFDGIDTEVPAINAEATSMTSVTSIVDNNSVDDYEYTQNLARNDYDEKIQSILLWQENSYYLLFFITTIVIPVLVTVYICHDTFIHGLVYPGLLRMFLCQQSLLSTESVCHLKHLQASIPTQPFNDKNSSHNCNNPLISILTYGQALQNYHHEFPHDYRGTSSKLAFDPTKWFIWTLEKLLMVDEICRTPENLIVQLQLQQQQQVINRMRSQLNWGTPISKLPLITPKAFKRIIASSANKDRIYIVIQNVIYDITPFVDQHPGGVPLLKASHGKDATTAFYGGVYGHLTAAVNLLATMRIGLLDVGNDEEVWRRVVREEGEVEDADIRQRNPKSYSTAEAA